jgi:hypothetical protein
MSPDGKTVHLLFSGDDSFSVRQGLISPWFAERIQRFR